VFSTPDLQVVRFAAIDQGVSVELGLEELRLQASRHSPAHFTLGRAAYGPGEQGLLLYVKSSLTGNEVEYVLDYRARQAAFPHEPTTHQLFDEAQFEAYRALGYHIGADLFRPALLGAQGAGKLTLRSWFAALAENLLRSGVIRPDYSARTHERKELATAASNGLKEALAFPCELARPGRARQRPPHGRGGESGP
jgi:hypothetical protein